MEDKKRYTEATPLENRDDYQAWQKKHDEEESKSSKDKYRVTLLSRNTVIYEAWRQFIMSIREHAFRGGGKGFKEFLNEKYLLQTGYYDSFSFYTSNFDIHDELSGGLGIEVFYKDSGEAAGGDVFEDFIPNLKKYKGAELYFTAAVSLPEGSEVQEITDSERQQLNIYTKDIVASGKASRKTVAGLVQFFKEVIDGNADKYFPGAKEVRYFGLESQRPAVIVAYDVPLIPDIDDDKIYDIIRGAEKLYNEIRPVLD